MALEGPLQLHDSMTVTLRDTRGSQTGAGDHQWEGLNPVNLVAFLPRRDPAMSTSMAVEGGCRKRNTSLRGQERDSHMSICGLWHRDACLGVPFSKSQALGLQTREIRCYQTCHLLFSGVFFFLMASPTLRHVQKQPYLFHHLTCSRVSASEIHTLGFNSITEPLHGWLVELWTQRIMELEGASKVIKSYLLLKASI